eukprot:CAMPEP_0206001062 /NCGR_PEP_ID=MMETSP1464-20131121/1870_1 /ASSEMBLY_ACC=CAM_ASM_001124 /TAXON_ID=119497 /ORGANISM="Exanthemachrysis gayraliae, Strain RCC1523" /LENGTH=59 /DNA_ID=CAMNT_0053374345 /DNA_START=54 /DNA_END=233 /DNA_ORIENTATION=-
MSSTLRALRRRAQQGHAGAIRAGRAPPLGQRGAQDIDAAMEWYRNAADQGHMEAEARLE